MDSGTVTKTAVISAARISLFVFCRKYLLQSLYYDLRRIATTVAGAPSSPSGNERFELGALPAPVTTTRSENSLFTSSTILHDPTSANGSFHTASASAAFAWCFSECCVLFALVMFQGLDIFDAHSRSLNWRISLTVVVALTLVVIPLLQSYFLTYPSRTNGGSKRGLFVRLILTCIPFSIYVFLFNKIPLPPQETSPIWVSSAISRLTVLGTLILGLLSGYGAISTVWTFLTFRKHTKQKEVSDREIIAAEQALVRVRNDLLERNKTIEAREAGNSDRPKERTTWMASVGFGSTDSELSSIKHEIKGLISLENQMSRSLDALKARKSSSEFDGTLAGKAWGWFGRLFSIYCIARLCSSILNLVFPAATSSSSSSDDLIPHLIAWFISHISSNNSSLRLSEEAILNLSRQISLVFVGVIILSSIRQVLSGVGRLLRITSKSLGASLMLLLLAQLMGVYLLSTLIQLRTSFPSDQGNADDAANLFSSLPEYQVFGATFDASFLLAAIGSLVVRWIHNKVDGSEWPDE